MTTKASKPKEVPVRFKWQYERLKLLCDNETIGEIFNGTVGYLVFVWEPTRTKFVGRFKTIRDAMNALKHAAKAKRASRGVGKRK